MQIENIRLKTGPIMPLHMWGHDYEPVVDCVLLNLGSINTLCGCSTYLRIVQDDAG